MAQVQLAASGLAPSVLAVLLRAGFRYEADLDGLSVRELANETKLSIAEAAAVLAQVVASSALSTASATEAMGPTALDVLQEAIKWKPIATRIEELDELLGGGLQRGELTEICGGPGVGKTQLGIHICLAAQFTLDAPSDRKASAIYIDTEGSFVIERVASMATHFIEDFVATSTRPRMERDDLLRGITYYRVHDYVEQLEVLQSLPALLRAHTEYKVVVVDTVAFHFRHGFEDYSQRTRALDALAGHLHSLATEFHIAIVLVNHMTTKSQGNTQRNTLPLETPALGETWSHAITNRLVLVWEAQGRVARIIKSATQAHRSARFEGELLPLQRPGRQELMCDLFP